MLNRSGFTVTKGQEQTMIMRPDALDIQRAARMLTRSILKAVTIRGGLTLQLFSGAKRLSKLD
jgi:hypothetical protein